MSAQRCMGDQKPRAWARLPCSERQLPLPSAARIPDWTPISSWPTEVGRVVEELEHLVGFNELFRDTGLPGEGLELGPKGPFAFREFGAGWGRVTNPDVSYAIRLDRGVRRRRHLEH